VANKNKKKKKCDALTSRRAWGSALFFKGEEAAGVIPGGTAPSADLGGSSKYSNENFED
jgi:hypothetical protein